MFARKIKQTKEDDDLEKEIEASLTRPMESNESAEKKVKSRGRDETSAGKKKQMKNPFKNSLKKVNLSKFGSIVNQRPSKSSSQSIIREEESLFFEEESLDDTEELVTIQTENLDQEKP